VQLLRKPAQAGEAIAERGSVPLAPCCWCPRDITGLVRTRTGKRMSSKRITSISDLSPMPYIKKVWEL